MTQAGSRTRLAMGPLMLGAAIVVAVAVGAFLFLSGGGESSPSQVETVESLYDAIARKDAAAYQALLDPEIADAGYAPAPWDSKDAAFAANAASVQSLKVLKLVQEGAWAGVKVTGKVGGTDLNDAVYLHRIGDTWKVTTAQEFALAGKTPSGNNAGLGPIDPQRPKEGQPAPDFALLDARDGTTVRKLSDYRGKAVILNWFASWCDPCKEEIPDFQHAMDTSNGELIVLGVNFLESQDRANGILNSLKATYPAVLDSDGDVAYHYRVGGGLPVTFFVDKDGVLRGMQSGRVKKADLEAQLAKVGITYQAP